MNTLLSDQQQEWLKRHGIKKTELAAALRIRDSQVITNWIGRGSIPKQYIDPIRALVASQDWDSGRRAMRHAYAASSLIKPPSDPPSDTDREPNGYVHQSTEINEESIKKLIGEIHRYLIRLPKQEQRKVVCAAMNEMPLDEALTLIEVYFHSGLSAARGKQKE